ncbi:MAG: cytochrome c oxidase subunit II [Gemmatimonadetes bacterium]|nr:cytochrome c oxidase subunit II [Gemmatimonadota bacterium]
MPRRHKRWLTTLLLSVTGCAGPFPQTTLAPKSDFGIAIDQLFTNIFWWAVAVFVVVEGLLLYAIIRFRARPGAPPPKATHGHTALEIGWTLAPAVILVFIAVPTIQTIFRTSGQAPDGAMQVEVIGHQWWWEFRYPDLGVVTANELHLPVGRPVALAMTSADVIHSYWAPGLGGKRDVILGRTSRLAFTADSIGTYYGQCAEFCGESHANMRLRVVVDSASAFDAWVAREQAGPAPIAPGSVEEKGRAVFARSACIACHTMEDVPAARAVIGPNLTHVGARSMIGSEMVENRPDHLAQWIANSAAMKPGSKMPPMVLPPEDLTALVAYLRSRQ